MRDSEARCGEAGDGGTVMAPVKVLAGVKYGQQVHHDGALEQLGVVWMSFVAPKCHRRPEVSVAQV